MGQRAVWPGLMVAWGRFRAGRAGPGVETGALLSSMGASWSLAAIEVGLRGPGEEDPGPCLGGPGEGPWVAPPQTLWHLRSRGCGCCLPVHLSVEDWAAQFTGDGQGQGQVVTTHRGSTVGRPGAGCAALEAVAGERRQAPCGDMLRGVDCRDVDSPHAHVRGVRRGWHLLPATPATGPGTWCPPPGRCPGLGAIETGGGLVGAGWGDPSWCGGTELQPGETESPGEGAWPWVCPLP